MDIQGDVVSSPRTIGRYVRAEGHWLGNALAHAGFRGSKHVYLISLAFSPGPVR